MAKAFRILALVFLLIMTFIVAKLFINHSKAKARAEQNWERHEPVAIADFGSTQSLSILPLIDFHTDNPDLKTEAGVSYLIRTDNTTILFDIGFNANNENPSPLAHNMKILGVDVSQIDMIFISHNHLDHVGGLKFKRTNTFGISLDQHENFNTKSIYTPVNMTYTSGKLVTISNPTILAQGVATTGTIGRGLFLGYIEEQALVINVKNKGLVLIVGCGHQTLTKLIERTQQTFNQPIYGIIGGLHYPIPHGRVSVAGIDAQRLLASGSGPFEPLTLDNVTEDRNQLEKINLGFVALGGHDTNDKIIELFAATFGDVYHYIKVGETIGIEE